MVTSYSRKNTVSSFFSKFSDFLPKNFIIREENSFLGFITTWYAFYSKFAIFSHFEKKVKIVFKNPSIFSRKSQILNAWRSLFVSVAFCGKFATFWWWKNFTFWREETADVGVTAIGNVAQNNKTRHLTNILPTDLTNALFSSFILSNLLGVIGKENEAKTFFCEKPNKPPVMTKCKYNVVLWIDHLLIESIQAFLFSCKKSPQLGFTISKEIKTIAWKKDKKHELDSWTFN